LKLKLGLLVTGWFAGFLGHPFRLGLRVALGLPHRLFGVRRAIRFLDILLTGGRFLVGLPFFFTGAGLLIVLGFTFLLTLVFSLGAVALSGTLVLTLGLLIVATRFGLTAVLARAGFLTALGLVFLIAFGAGVLVRSVPLLILVHGVRFRIFHSVLGSLGVGVAVFLTLAMVLIGLRLLGVILGILLARAFAGTLGIVLIGLPG